MGADVYLLVSSCLSDTKFHKWEERLQDFLWLRLREGILAVEKEAQQGRKAADIDRKSPASVLSVAG